MTMKYHEQQDQKRPLPEQDTTRQGDLVAPPPLTPLRQQPPPPRHWRWVLVSVIAIVLVLALTLGTVFLFTSSPGQQTNATSTATTTPAGTATLLPGDTTPTPAPGVTQGPQQGPSSVQDLAYWDKIIGTQLGVNKVESVSFANLMDTPAPQAIDTSGFRTHMEA